MIGCIARVRSPLTKYARLSQTRQILARFQNLSFQWKDFKEKLKEMGVQKKFEEFKENHIPPTDKDKMYFKALGGFLAASILIYLLKEERSEEISL